MVIRARTFNYSKPKILRAGADFLKRSNHGDLNPPMQGRPVSDESSRASCLDHSQTPPHDCDELLCSCHLDTDKRHPAHTSAFVLALALVGGCWGSIHDPGGECGVAPAQPARRLSHAEYRNTVRDLFPGLALPAFDSADDPTPRGFDNDAAALQPSSLLIGQYNVAATRIAPLVVANGDRFVPCAARDSACGGELIRGLATRAFRRPIAADEQATLQLLFDTELASNGFDIAAELAIEAILQAPAFLYRIDSEPQYDTATRLSYLLWATMPDDALFAAAGAGQLATGDDVEREVDRMLDDPRALDGFMNFSGQWLDLSRLDRTTKNVGDGLTDGVRAALAAEARQFLTEIIYARGGTLTDLLTSRRVFISPETAAFYGLPTPQGSIETDLPADRKGFLMQAEFLASHAHPNNPSPVLRGKFVLSQLLCIELGSPPAGVDMSIPESNPTTGPSTNRQNYERATAEPLCQSCHSLINPIGFTFERFDTMGRLLATDNGLPIDPSGLVDGTPVADASAMVDLLAGSEQVRDCVTRKYMLYATSGTAIAEDRCLVDDVSNQFVASGGSLRGLMRSIATHPRFLGLEAR